MDAPTLHAALDEAASRRPHVAVSFPGGPGELSLADLSTGSRRMAARLRELGAGPGDRIGALFTNEPDFLLLLFAISRLGACIAPMPLPVSAREAYPARIRRVLDNAGIKDAVVSRRLSRLRPLAEQALAGRRLLSLDELAPVPGTVAEVGDGQADPDREFILQYTSGSTATPKGVPLSHSNVLACVQAIRTGIDLAPGDRNGIWLPFFHDMGLFGTLTAVLAGIPCTVWQPSAFIKDPRRWLREFADSGHTISAMPNFAYDYLVRAVPADEVAEYDLSRWRVAFNGAELVSVESVESFLAHFAAAGFGPQAMMPVYGLAEATLAVTFPPIHRGPLFDWADRAVLAGKGVAIPVGREDPGARGLISVGHPVLGMRLRIADPDGGEVLGERRVGEVQLRGPSVTAGYAGDADPAQLFTADGWLRTGDLGYLAGGELFITGRIKEMIILRGANYYPDDVENAVRTEPGVYRKRCVAFVSQVTDGLDRMTLVAETARPAGEHGELAGQLRACVQAALGLDDLMIVLAPPHSIPRTTSGKLQRIDAKQRFSP